MTFVDLLSTIISVNVPAQSDKLCIKESKLQFDSTKKCYQGFATIKKRAKQT